MSEEKVNTQRHTDRVWSVSWSPNGSKLASASGDPFGDDSTVRIWDGKQISQQITGMD